ncbi:MAG: S1 family peptidase [Anaerolineales bacterium]
MNRPQSSTWATGWRAHRAFSAPAVILAAMALVAHGGSADERAEREKQSITAQPLEAPAVLLVERGVPVSEGEFPFAVALDVQGQVAKCTGALIADQWVLTAAHCGCLRKAIVGRTDLRRGDGQRLDIDRGFKHAGFDQTTGANDIGLHHLKNPASGVPPVLRVRSNGWQLQHSSVTVMGWGALENGQHPPRLHEATLDTVANASCAHDHLGRWVITDEHLCTSSVAGGVLLGDSGGPVIMRPIPPATGPAQLVAVIGRDGGFPKDTSPDIHARVNLHQAWIADIQAGRPRNVTGCP